MKCPFSRNRENPRRYPSPEVDPSRGQDLEGHVARLGPQDRGEEVKRPDTDITGIFPVKSFFDDQGDGVGLAGKRLAERSPVRRPIRALSGNV